MCSSKDTTEIPLQSLTISADTDTIYDINTNIPVNFIIEPNDATLNDLTCNSDGGTFQKNSDASALVFSASEPGIYTIFISDRDVESNKLIIHVVDKDALVAESIAEAEEESRQLAESESRRIESEEEIQMQEDTEQALEEMVWIPASGSKYHRNSSCSNMNSPTQVTISQAQSWGYSPCKRCY